MSQRTLEMEVKVGIFVTIGLGLIMTAILVLGSTENLTSSKVHYRSHFQAVDGLITGAKVVLGGITVGTVDSIRFDPNKRDITVNYNITKESTQWIRKDTIAEIATQGVLGDKYISLTMGSLDQSEISPGGEIEGKESKGLNQFISKGDTLLVSLNSIAVSLDEILKALRKNKRSDRIFENLAKTTEGLSHALEGKDLKLAIKNLNGILEKINRGTGTVGALINDPALYDDVKSLVGGANRNRVMRNLVRQTIKDNERAEAEASRKVNSNK